MNDSLIPPRVVGTPEPEANADNDPELAALLDFEPVPRKVNRPDSWTPERQRRFIELILQTGSPQQAARAMKKQLSGIEEVYRDDEKGEFRAAWDGVCELVRRREERRLKALNREQVPEPPHRRTDPHSSALSQREEGQVLNEFGEWEDEASLHRRAEEARDSVSNKLLQARRFYLQEISGSPGKRAAFEILTELPIDWERAERLEPQPDEPWRDPRVQNWNHAPFTYSNPDGTRFFAPEQPALELSQDIQTALVISVGKRETFLSRTREKQIALEMRVITRRVKGRFADGTGWDPNLSDEERRLRGREVAKAGLDGLLFRPLERPSGVCASVLRGEALGRAIQGDHFKFMWDGQRISALYSFSSGKAFAPAELRGPDTLLAA